MNRIESICSFINDNDLVVDVGCDQVKVGILLSKRNIKSIASDISEKVVKSAYEKINKLNLNNYIDLRVSNGLNNIKDGEANTLVLAGMGTHTILEILKDTTLRFNKIITISNNYHYILRSEMNKLNYKVNEELIIYEKNKYYNLIVFIPGNKEYNEKELLLGLNHKDIEMYSKYLTYLENKYLKIQKKSNNKNIRANKMLEYIRVERS